MRRIWITADPYGALSAGEVAAASAAEAGEILHGIPDSLADVIEAGTLGLVELEEPTHDDAPVPPDPAEAMRAALAGIGPTSTSAQVRTALLALKAALAE